MGLKCTFVKHLPSLGQQESCPFFCIRLTYFCILFLSTATTCEPLLYVTRVAKQLPRPALSNSIQCRLNRSPVRPSPYGAEFADVAIATAASACPVSQRRMCLTH